MSTNAEIIGGLNVAEPVTSENIDTIVNDENSIADITVLSTAKETPVNADLVPLVDSANSNALKKLTWANLKATLLTYFYTLFMGAFESIASATTTAIGGTTSNNVYITGTTTITGFGTIAAGITRRVRFADALTLTHNGTSLILPGSANITTAANDTADFVSLGSGNWLCTNYKKASGAAIVGGATVVRHHNGSIEFETTNGSDYQDTGVGYTLAVGKTYDVDIVLGWYKNTADTLDIAFTANSLSGQLAEFNRAKAITCFNDGTVTAIKLDPEGDGDYLRYGTGKTTGTVLIKGRLTAGVAGHKLGIYRSAGSAAAVSVNYFSATFTQLD
jgi:hypothetical protein